MTNVFLKLEKNIKTIQNPWIIKDITKPFKKKQNLYDQFLKKRTPQNEQKYKMYKNLFKTIKKKAKKIYYSKKLLKCIGDIKKVDRYEKYNWKIKNKINKSST